MLIRQKIKQGLCTQGSSHLPRGMAHTSLVTVIASATFLTPTSRPPLNLITFFAGGFSDALIYAQQGERSLDIFLGERSPLHFRRGERSPPCDQLKREQSPMIQARVFGPQFFYLTFFFALGFSGALIYAHLCMKGSGHLKSSWGSGPPAFQTEGAVPPV